MKVVLVILLYAVVFAAPALAQDQSAMLAAQSVCGPGNMSFEAVVDNTQHPTPQPEPDKALVYLVLDRGVPQSPGSLVTRVGMDGAWVGANPGSSYIFFLAKPGEHHLCVTWQSRFAARNNLFAMTDFTAEAGRVYYFRERLIAIGTKYFFDLDPVNRDQGKFLVAASPFGVWHLKK